MLKDQVVNLKNKRLYGAFTNDGRTTPTATRLEGLLAAYSFLSEDIEYKKKIFDSISRGIVFLSEAQVKKGDFEVAITRVTGNAKGADYLRIMRNGRATEVRIDYVQHALSAFISYLGVLKKSEKQ